MHASIGMRPTGARGVGEWSTDRDLLWVDNGHACPVGTWWMGLGVRPEDDCEATSRYDGLWEPELADAARVLSVVGVAAFGVNAQAWKTASDAFCDACNVEALVRWGEDHPLWGRVFALSVNALDAIALGDTERRVLQQSVRRHYEWGVYAQRGVLPLMGDTACAWCGRLVDYGTACGDGGALANCDASRILDARGMKVFR